MSQSPWPDPFPQPPRQDEGGVYHAVKPRVNLEEQDLYVPRFLSPEFFQFLFHFVAHPNENAMFMKEWRCSRRRLRLEGVGGLLMGVALAVAGCVALSGAGLAVGLLSSMGLQELYVHIVYLLPSIVAGILGFFFSIRGGGSLADRQVLEDLTLTLLKPQEIVFGYLTGGILPYTLIVIPLLPGAFLFASIMLVMESTSMNFSPIHGPAMVILMYPNVMSSILMTSAIAIGVSYGGKSLALAMIEGLVAWAVVLATVLYLTFLLRVTSMDPRAFSVLSAVAMPFLILLKLSVAGGFLHHTAVRLAQRQAEVLAGQEAQPGSPRSTSIMV